MIFINTGGQCHNRPFPFFARHELLNHQLPSFCSRESLACPGHQARTQSTILTSPPQRRGHATHLQQRQLRPRRLRDVPRVTQLQPGAACRLLNSLHTQLPHVPGACGSAAKLSSAGSCHYGGDISPRGSSSHHPNSSADKSAPSLDV